MNWQIRGSRSPRPGRSGADDEGVGGEGQAGTVPLRVLPPDGTQGVACLGERATEAPFGCQVGQIAKSLVFRSARTERPILVIASGVNRVNEKRIERLISEPVERADADFVRRHTGFAIGGVPPIGHSQHLQTFIDEDLFQYEEIWAAAGHPRAVFRLTPADLVEMTGGRVTAVK